MVDTKQTKTIGEHYVAAELARRGWAPAFTRDGLERTDILAVFTESDNRRMIEVQVKTALRARSHYANWPLGVKAQGPSKHEREYFVLVAVPHNLEIPPRYFVVPRAHVAAAAWIEHMNWLTDPEAEPGKRNAPVERARVKFRRSSSMRIGGICSSLMSTMRQCCSHRITEPWRRQSESVCHQGTLGTRHCRIGKGRRRQCHALEVPLFRADNLVVQFEKFGDDSGLFLIP